MSEAALIDPHNSNEGITARISSIALARRTPAWWLLVFAVALAGTGMLLVAVAWLLVRGVGIWGVDIPVAWGFAITNFVWWIGIGHAGTLISAFLLLMRQKWRNSINRFAEAMTIFAVANAGLFPLLHLGRPWVFYWLIPYPDTMDLWPQFRSPLVWDFAAVLTYMIVSLVFWYMGMIPDLATLRDRARGRVRKYAYAVLALGWRGDLHHWERYEKIYLLLAGLATPLVVSVHSVVSLDFAVAVVPGWHSTIYPPYFVAGAVFSGLGMALTLGIPIRAIFGLRDLITEKHLDNMAKVMLLAGLIVAYGYFNEFFLDWYSGDLYERFRALNKVAGPYWPGFAAMMLGNVLVPQLLWSKKVRTNTWLLFAIAILVNVGMWSERFVIVIGALHRDFVPSAWRMFHPTGWDWATLAGTLAFFAVLFLLFLRLLPIVSMAEERKLLHEVRSAAILAAGPPASSRQGCRRTGRLEAGAPNEEGLRPAGGVRHGGRPGTRRADAAHPRLPPRPHLRAIRREGSGRTVRRTDREAEDDGHRAAGLRRRRGRRGGRDVRAGVRQRGRLSAERRREAAQQLAVLHSDRVRAGHPRRRARGGGGVPDPQFAAAVPPPALQCGALRARHPGSLLPLRREARPKVRRRENGGAAAGDGRGHRGGAVVRRALLLAALLACGCPHQMIDRPAKRPLGSSAFFPDRSASRPLVADTVPRSAPDGGGAVTPERGRERFAIYCAPCHGARGDGDGIIVRHGFPRPPALRAMATADIVKTIADGHGVMYGYGDAVPERDRWAIAAYMQQLQRERAP